MASFNHKCHFHPQQPITKFCSQVHCTLPLCQECEPIHLDEHKEQNHNIKLMTFSEAYHQAQSQIESFLSKEKKSIREYERQLENDREAVISYIDAYYSKLSREIQQNKGKCHQLEEKLNKLKKGSIKTLIFYFSGDIELTHEKINFQPLLKMIDKERKEESSNNLYNTKYEKSEHQPQLTKDYHKIHSISAAKLSQVSSLDHHNVFNNIKEIKMGEKNRQKNRKSIFENNNKKSQEIISQPQNRSPSNKYKYNINPSLEQQEEEIRKESQESAITLHKDYINKQKVKSKEKTIVEEQTPVSFENRYKFTGSEQYEAYKKEREEKVFKEISINQNKREEKVFKEISINQNNISQKLPNKLEKKSELLFNLQKEENVIQPNPSSVGSQRMRSISQATIVNHNNDPRIDNTLYDLKKQVLPPEQIRKMLEKRIEERNRILSIKKSENYGGPAQLGKKGWETRDSIINQIYSDKN